MNKTFALSNEYHINKKYFHFVSFKTITIIGAIITIQLKELKVIRMLSNRRNYFGS